MNVHCIPKGMKEKYRYNAHHGIGVFPTLCPGNYDKLVPT